MAGAGETRRPSRPSRGRTRPRSRRPRRCSRRRVRRRRRRARGSRPCRDAPRRSSRGRRGGDGGVTPAVVAPEREGGAERVPLARGQLRPERVDVEPAGDGVGRDGLGRADHLDPVVVGADLLDDVRELRLAAGVERPALDPAVDGHDGVLVAAVAAGDPRDARVVGAVLDVDRAVEPARAVLGDGRDGGETVVGRQRLDDRVGLGRPDREQPAAVALRGVESREVLEPGRRPACADVGDRTADVTNPEDRLAHGVVGHL